jgi:hypothetical protein
MEFIEASTFTRCLADYFSDDSYRALQAAMAREALQGDLMPGTGGFRKMRWADKRRGKGRRGGLWVIYYYFASAQQVWLVTVYDKNEVADLTPKEKKTLNAAIEAELRARDSGRREPKGSGRP